MGDRIATKFNNKTGKVNASCKVVTIQPASNGLEEYAHNHHGHIHVNMGLNDALSGCWDMFTFIPVVEESTNVENNKLPKSKLININGVVYVSVADAMAHTNLSYKQIMRYVNTKV